MSESFRWFSVLMPAFALAINVGTHILLFRLKLMKSMLRAVVTGFIVGFFFLCLVVLVSFYFFPQAGLEVFSVYILNIFTYGLLGYCYFHFNNLGETARRIRILREFFEHGSMTEGELLERYMSSVMIDVRLGRLIRASQIEIALDGSMRIKDRSVLRMAIVMIRLKHLLLGRETLDFDEGSGSKNVNNRQ